MLITHDHHNRDAQLVALSQMRVDPPEYQDFTEYRALSQVASWDQTKRLSCHHPVLHQL